MSYPRLYPFLDDIDFGSDLTTLFLLERMSAGKKFYDAYNTPH
jgi:hypothetical protein